MSLVINIFKEITKIPRCSGVFDPFIKYTQQFAKKYNYICEVDDANNILCYKDNSSATIALQSHYDIVCLKDNTIPTIVEEDGFLTAQDSTLGADNGIGCAYMFALMQKGYDLEFLFTSDEEIGLIGASNITFDLKANYMLNLDSEAQGEICIGCAGGVDIKAINQNFEYIQNNNNALLYEIEVSNLPGGHSGVDIDKNIPNSIKLLSGIIKSCNGDIIDINGGERINSIPVYAKAIIASTTPPISTNPNIKITQIDSSTKHYKKLSDDIVNFLYTFPHGVRAYDKEIDVVLNSINLAMIKTTIDGVEIEFSARSMDNDELSALTKETTALLECFGFSSTTSGKYPAWKPIHSEFTAKVLEIYKKHIQNATLNAIHAGLECAIFKDKYPNLQICSIGPNIYFPHSKNEKVEISSIEKVYNILEDIVSS